MWRSMESGGGGGGGGGGSGGGIAGKKRKAAGVGGGSGYGDRAAVMRREPRRGLGVADLERIRVQLEAAQSLFMTPPSLSTSSSAVATQLRPLPPPSQVAGVRYGQQQCVGNGGVQRDHHFAPYYGSSPQQQQQQHYTTNDALTRFLAPSSSNQALQRQINQTDKCVAVNSSPLLRRHQGSSKELYRLQLQDYHRRREQPHGGATETRSQSIPFVNLVDSDDDEAAAGAGAGKELDLELRL